MDWALDTAAVCGLVGALTGLVVPRLIAQIPEPGASGGSAAAPEADQRGSVRDQQESAVAGSGPTAAKEPYAAIAALPGLAWRTALAGALAGAAIGASVGWSWSLMFLLYLVPVGTALALVDWRTRLLPTKVIAPSYAVVAVLATAAAALSQDWSDLLRAGAGLLLARGTFWLLWLVYPRGMGFGDVRLAGLLGLALGYLGWGQLALGVYAGFVLGGVGGVLLAMLRLVDRKAYPFGPFMLVGALVGVVLGQPLVDYFLSVG